LKEAILKAEKINTNDISYLHAISRTPELGGLYLRRKDYEICMSEAKENEEFLLFETGEDSWEFEEFLSEIKTALFLKDWIEEETEESIRKKYNLGPGDIRRKVELADWLLYSMQEIGRLFKAGKSKDVARIRLRVKHGVKKELLPLVSIKGIGRARARRLYRKGFRNKRDLKKASVEEISKVELIGKKIAIKIKEQLGEEGRRIQSKLIQG
jgi:helicase